MWGWSDVTNAFKEVAKVVTVVAEVASYIPSPIGMVASGVAAVGYLAQGDYTSAAIAVAGIALAAVGAGALVKVAKVWKAGEDAINVGKVIKATVSVSKSAGRSGKQARLVQLSKDPKLSRSLRGEITRDMNQIQRGKRKNIRVPQGHQLAHKRGFEAKKGYGYKYSNLQETNLHKLQHKYGGY